MRRFYFKYKNGATIEQACNISMDTKMMENVCIERGTTISHCKLGKSVYIGPNCSIFHSSIGNYTSIGPKVTIGENEHIMTYPTTCNALLPHAILDKYTLSNKQSTNIENDVWIGTGAFIKKGITIGNGAVIAAHAVVTKNVPAYAIVAGVPAKILKYRFSGDCINELLESKWWNQDLKQIHNQLNQLTNDENSDKVCKSFIDLLKDRS